MRLVTVITILLLVSRCATAMIEHQITTADTAWIQQGVTTRSQIETRFGPPSFEVPEYAASTRETASASTPRNDEYNPKTPSTAPQVPKDTKATYVHPLSEAEMESSYGKQTKQDRFWVIYDEKNVVKDFGFEGPPTTPSAASQPPVP